MGKLPVFIPSAHEVCRSSVANVNGRKYFSLSWHSSLLFYWISRPSTPLLIIPVRQDYALTRFPSKHMDKHTRPYVCNLPGCEKVRGFTYSGGLSRHQREVHRQNGGPKASYMCPHSDCKRSTGSGFSRRENLQEHLRRVHRHPEDVAVEKRVSQETNIRVSGEPRRRRRRVSDDDNDEAQPRLIEPRKRRRENEDEDKDDDTDDDTDENRNPRENLSAQVKRLRRELQEKDERLRRLEETVELLTKRSVQPV